ncbi:mannonate dehydratase [Arthrobacter sp. JUb119]|uniref:D-mannonate dehydratase ManD n=1 Tax=Arthrobacter sp. JUb115 TaxID=2485108 RepID=UPI00105D753D|nr:D-mannonate dehydratase ManD [Arthrobacter sp. JUb115]MCS3494522.1 mannonate dehydratase [Arthrobacter sp. JUb119]TDU22612.1 D-mannonate dehydratase [Arthrobacter sp. JUb115]
MPANRTITAAEVFVSSPSRNYVTLKITTSDGLVGYGDATVNGRELSVASYLKDHLCPALIGRDAERIEDTWQFFYKGAYWRRGPITMAAIGAIDMALWDIKGKAADMPVYQLLGGAARDKILTYTHATGWGFEELMDSVAQRQTEGFRAVRVQFGVPGLEKVYGVTREAATYEPAGRGIGPVTEDWDSAAYLRTAPQMLARVRDAVGDELHLLHDVHHRLTPSEAARLAQDLEVVRLFWLEDVMPAENPQLLRQVRNQSTIPLAIGEVFNTIWDCQQILTERLVDYIRCAVVHAGGISHMRKILALAEVFNVQGAPHGPSDVSPINMAASLHLGLATSNFAIQEHMGYDPLVSEVFTSHYTFNDGYLHPSDKPGLGVEFDEKAARKFEYRQAYLPVARNLDGSVKDW